MTAYIKVLADGADKQKHVFLVQAQDQLNHALLILINSQYLL